MGGGTPLRPLELIKLMRPKHYIKNFLIFVSITFDRDLFHPQVLLRVLMGFAAFCLLTSAVYVLNDIRDVEADRQHEVKRNRPIASGAVPIPAAWALAAALLVCALAIHLAACGSQGLGFMLAYFAVNLGYSLGLKHVPFLDIVLLVMGFVLRVLYGAAIVSSSTSAWVYLTVFSLSFYLGLGKRRNELKRTQGSTRKVLQYYSYEFLDKFMYLCLTLAVTFYALWSADAQVAAKYGTDKLIWTVPLVIISLMKYSADIESNSYGDPVDVVMHDKVLLLLGGALVLMVVGLIYLPGL
ncbi:decaprenyl-phosphate phosphoribosyltransferase [Pseudoflavonifractor sp. 60]|uniref:decaprenyl-phosphate phosphoribosyltransferase n=1 Tax=Pseudoflavonifractor sp. 60 TaxID=2304576 RepID=UPI00136C2EA1|nr:decaprenyl-phosphate phosphoribosyltransferase [Pseudoflavonifractor sp. 60]NBI69279.1 decaprenyl-phosphate phosphoribosyltransferase [Pseudoflavonifractor sp. 60]